MIEVDTSTELCGIAMRSPFMIASGTYGSDGFGEGLDDSFLDSFGAVVMKTVTKQSIPHYAGVTWDNAHAINSVGLANPGLDYIVESELERFEAMPVPVVLSLAITGNDREWRKIVKLLRGAKGIAAIELNLSCPNSPIPLFVDNPSLMASVVKQVAKGLDFPVFVKLSPVVSDIGELVYAAEDNGASAIVISNSIPAMRYNIYGQPVVDNVLGGMSGIALHPVALAQVYRASNFVDIPIIGVGGIMTAGCAMSFIRAGASAVQLGTACMRRSTQPAFIYASLCQEMRKAECATWPEFVEACRDPVGWYWRINRENSRK